MIGNESTELASRSVAAQEALRVVSRHGVAVGEFILRGYAVAFVLALAAVIGAAATWRMLESMLPDYRKSDKPRLVWDRENET